MSGLFAKPTVIDNEKLVAEKQRTIVQIKKKERKQKKRDERKAAKNGDDASNNDNGTADQNVADKEHPEHREKVGEKMDLDDDDGALEDKYMSKLVESEAEESGDEESENEESEDSDDEAQVGEAGCSDEEGVEDATMEESTKSAETANGKPTKTKTTAAQVLDLKDKEFEKAERTIFIGNVPSIIISSKRETKDFKNFINKSLECPENTSLIESVRFRSLHSTTTAPRKVAYISKEVDLENVMNAYVVFKSKDVSLKAKKLNGVVYRDHHLRIDHLTHPTKKDNKLSIFVGNLDFQEKEETLWKYFNDKLIEKKDKKDTKNVIENVRIVRDSKTSFGKGFAIIQFIDTNYVTKALLLNGKKMGKRTLRITRSKKIMRNNDDMRKKFSKLNDQQKTVVGRAKQLGKGDRKTLGKLVVEGERAVKGKTVLGRNGVVKQRHGARKERRAADARVTKRSQAFKEKLAAEASSKNKKK